MRGSARWEIYRAFDRGRETGEDDVARAMEDAHDGLEGSRRVRGLGVGRKSLREREESGGDRARRGWRSRVDEVDGGVYDG